MLFGAFPFRIGVGKQPADVAGAGGAEDRVRDGVTDDVGVRMAVETELERNRDAGEDQRAAGDQTMQVVAVADSDQATALEAGRSPNGLSLRQILRRRDLHVARVAFDDVDRHAEALDQHRFIGRVDVLALGQRARQHVAAKRLRRLREKHRSRGIVARIRRDPSATASPACLTVSRTPIAAIAAPCCSRAVDGAIDHARASRTAAPRRESAMMSASFDVFANAFATESCRRAPPATTVIGRPIASRSAFAPAST